MHNLTPRQKYFLRWIVEEVNSNRLPEAGIRFVFSKDGSCTIENYKGDKDNIPITSISTRVLDLFIQNRYMLVQRTFGNREIYECTLRAEAYDEAGIETERFSSKDVECAICSKLKSFSTSVSYKGKFICIECYKKYEDRLYEKPTNDIKEDTEVIQL